MLGVRALTCENLQKPNKGSNPTTERVVAKAASRRLWHFQGFGLKTDLKTFGGNHVLKPWYVRMLARLLFTDIRKQKEPDKTGL